MTTPSRFPVGPLVDLQTGLITLEWFMWFQNPEVQSIIFATPVDVPSGGTGLSSGTSGGILGFTSTTTMASSVLLSQFQLVVGGGAGATPVPLGSLGTATTVLHGNASGAPSFGAVSLTADVTGTLAIARGGTNSATALSGSSIMVSNGSAIIQGAKGFPTTVLHGNASGVPTYSNVIEDDQLLADVTTNNATVARHGYLKKLSGSATDVMNGAGNWVPASGGVTALAVAAVGYWSELTNGDPVAPELIFDSNGDTISVFTPTP